MNKETGRVGEGVSGREGEWGEKEKRRKEK